MLQEGHEGSMFFQNTSIHIQCSTLLQPTRPHNLNVHCYETSKTYVVIFADLCHIVTRY